MTIKGGKRSSHGSELFVDGIAVAIAEPIGKDDSDDAVSTATDGTEVSSEAPIEFDTTKRGRGDFRGNLPVLLCLAFSLFAVLVLAMANNVVKLPSCLTTPGKSLTFLGRWRAVDLAQGGDPGAPDEEIIEISETAIEFVNGGGGFANGPYSPDGSGSYTATQGEESIKFERDGDRLKVTFAGGGYGDAVTVYYNKEVDLPRNDLPSLTVPEITKYATFVGRNRVTLMLTTDEIQETSDFDAKCKSEYGPSARVADWSYDLLALDEDQVNEMIAVLDIAQTFNEKHYYVSNGGDKYFGGDTRAYFFENHGGNPPGNWLVHDQLGDITLGSWYGITGQVLCIQE